MKALDVSPARRPRLRLSWAPPLVLSAAVFTLIVALPCRWRSAVSWAQDTTQMPMPGASPTMRLDTPSLTFTPFPGYGPAPLMVGFFPHFHDPSGSPVVAYHWTFGDGQVATTPAILTYHTFAKPGTYVVTLTMTTADGASASAIAAVQVVAPAN